MQELKAFSEKQIDKTLEKAQKALDKVRLSIEHHNDELQAKVKKMEELQAEIQNMNYLKQQLKHIR